MNIQEADTIVKTEFTMEDCGAPETLTKGKVGEGYEVNPEFIEYCKVKGYLVAPTKKELLQSVNEDKATFIGEEWIVKDCWEFEYSYKGVTFYVNAYTQDRWLEDDPELISIGGV